jgi:hypothetical protein
MTYESHVTLALREHADVNIAGSLGCLCRRSWLLKVTIRQVFKLMINELLETLSYIDNF